MFRVIKPLNHNGLLALTEDGREVILLGRGIGFGRKSGERLASVQGAKVYRLLTNDKRSALQAVNSLDPHAVELAARILEEQWLKWSAGILSTRLPAIVMAG